VPRVQNLFKALQKRNVGDEEQLIVVVEEINSVSTPEPIRIPDSRRTGKRVDKAAILSMFRDLEVAKSLRFWQEEGCHVAIVGAVIDLALNRIVHDAIVASDLKDAPYDSWKHAMHHESISFQRSL
jgi:hypothetical protein